MRTILVVDDDPEIVELTSKRLTNCGYRVLTALDGSGALKMVAKERPDLILLDIIMPGMDGFSVLRELKKDEATRLIPIIMLSGKGETSSLMEGEDSGAIDYFIKPVDWKELLKYIKKYLD